MHRCSTLKVLLSNCIAAPFRNHNQMLLHRLLPLKVR